MTCRRAALVNTFVAVSYICFVCCSRVGELSGLGVDFCVGGVCPGGLGVGGGATLGGAVSGGATLGGGPFPGATLGDGTSGVGAFSGDIRFVIGCISITGVLCLVAVWNISASCFNACISRVPMVSNRALGVGFWSASSNCLAAIVAFSLEL